MTASLLVLARETSGGKRRELLRVMTDLLVDSEQRYSERELCLFSEIIGGLLDRLEPAARVEFSQKIAECDRSTGGLHARMAADDDLGVAAPVLERYDLFDDETLVDLARNKSQGHLLAISRRGRLNGAVTEILVERGGDEVVRAVTLNLGAVLSQRSFERISDRAKDDARLQLALSYRSDLPESVAARALEYLAPDHRRRLIALMGESGGATIGPAGLIAQIRDGLIDLDPVVRRLAREGRHADLAMVLQRCKGLSKSAVLSALFKVDNGAISALMRVAELSEPTVSAVADLRCRRLNLPSAMKPALIETWRILDLDSAQKILRLMRVRSSI